MYFSSQASVRVFSPRIIYLVITVQKRKVRRLSMVAKHAVYVQPLQWFTPGVCIEMFMQPRGDANNIELLLELISANWL